MRINNQYNERVTEVLQRLPYLLDGRYFTFFRWEIYLCRELTELGYLKKLKNNTYGVTSKGRTLRRTLQGSDPLECFVAQGHLRPLILDILVKIAQEDTDR
jgi:hypothetical protein